MLRLASRDHVVVNAKPCACGRTAPRIRCIGRTDDMLIVRGVNLFPTAVGEVLDEFVPEVGGMFSNPAPKKKGFPRLRRYRSAPNWAPMYRRQPGDLAARIQSRDSRKTTGNHGNYAGSV